MSAYVEAYRARLFQHIQYLRNIFITGTIDHSYKLFIRNISVVTYVHVVPSCQLPHYRLYIISMENKASILPGYYRIYINCLNLYLWIQGIAMIFYLRLFSRPDRFAG